MGEWRRYHRPPFGPGPWIVLAAIILFWLLWLIPTK